MNPLDDDELRSLLEQAKRVPPEPRPEMTRNALRAYQWNVVRPQRWRRILLRPVPIPWPAGTFAAVLLILLGVAAGHAFRRPTIILQTRNLEAPVTQERIVYRDCPAGSQESSPPVGSLFKEFQPVSQIRPRVIGSLRDDQ